MAILYTLSSSWWGDAKSRTQDYTFTGYVTKLQGTITLANTAAGEGSTQNVYLYLLVNGTYQEVYHETQRRGAGGSCTYNIDVELNEPLYATGARFYYTATDNEKSVNVNVDAIGGNHIVQCDVIPTGSGTITGTGTYISGSSVSVEANANGGFEFENWQLKGYTRLDYIESTGTQYIDTGVNTRYGFIAEYEISYNTTSGYQTPIGTIDGNTIRRYLAWRSSYEEFGFNGYYNIGNTPQANRWYKYKISTISGNGYVYIDDLLKYSRTNTFSASQNINLYFFANNWSYARDFFIGKAKSLKIWDNNNALIRNFIPVIRHSDGAIGLLDLVNFKFYGNSGTGSFIGGDVYAS